MTAERLNQASTEPAEHNPASRRYPVGRRRLLTIGGIAAMATATPLAACSSPSEQPEVPGTSSGAGSAGTSAGATPRGGVTVSTSEVPVGGGYIMEDEPYVLTQPTEGEYKAFNKICTHQGCPVSKIKGTSIQCLCHGSEFSITDGSVLQGPAEKPLAAVAATVSGDTITLG